jgi:hypothetical protein
VAGKLYIKRMSRPSLPGIIQRDATETQAYGSIPALKQENDEVIDNMLIETFFPKMATPENSVATEQIRRSLRNLSQNKRFIKHFNRPRL